MTLSADTKRNRDAYDALVAGKHSDPFSLLGLHRSGKIRVVRTLQPHAKRVELIDVDGGQHVEMERVHPGGVFVSKPPPRRSRYRLRITLNDDIRRIRLLCEDAGLREYL